MNALTFIGIVLLIQAVSVLLMVEHMASPWRPPLRPARGRFSDEQHRGDTSSQRQDRNRGRSADTRPSRFGHIGAGPTASILAVQLLIFVVGVFMIRPNSAGGYYSLAALSLLMALASGTTIRLVRANRRQLRDRTQMVRYCERSTARITHFLLDNPELAEIALLRTALLPTDAEMELVGFDPAFQDTLRDIRDGNGWRTPRLLGPPSLRLGQLCLRPRGHDVPRPDLQLLPPPRGHRLPPNQQLLLSDGRCPHCGSRRDAVPGSASSGASRR